MKYTTNALALLALLILAVAPAYGDEDLIIVSGRGEVEAEPDMATFTLGVSTLDFSAERAYSENNEKMSQIIEKVKKAGVDPADIKTTQFTIEPQYDYERNTGERVFKGYRVRHRLLVRLHALGILGRLLDTVVGAGVTDLSGISFAVEDPEEAESRARIASVEDAHRKALELASAAGVGLGRAVRIEETRYTPRPMMARAEASFGAAEEAPIEPGTQKVVVSVVVHYRIE
jgi:uncharacterized protein YggE